VTSFSIASAGAPLAIRGRRGLPNCERGSRLAAVGTVSIAMEHTPEPPYATQDQYPEKDRQNGE
jgi:hypothetical protein